MYGMLFLVIFLQLMEYLEIYNTLHQSAALEQNHSTEMAALHLVDDIIIKWIPVK